MTLTWNNLHISVINTNKKFKQKYLDIIKCTSGSVSSGQILAIMGPSGGGKSTLLNALAGRIPNNSITQGIIKYNNKDRITDEWCNAIGFVEQSVYLKDELTVSDTLEYIYEFFKTSKKISDLRTKVTNNNQPILIPSHKNMDLDDNSDGIGDNYNDFIDDNIKDAVQKVVRDLNLLNVMHNSIEKLSGGERKRVSIGTALMKNPSILFLDEPTSGLDTLSALKICRILKKMATELNKMIILTIHQPSNEIFYMFDQLLLLSEGNVIYYGLVSEVANYLGEKNIFKREQAAISEFVVEICCEEFKNENPEFFYNEESVFKENCAIKNKKILKTRNDRVMNYKPNLHHIMLLVKRILLVQRNRKIKFFKVQLFKIFMYCFIIFWGYKIPKLIEKLMIDDETLSFFLLSVFLATQISSSINSNIDNIDYIKSEISNGYYTASSYYIAINIYQILCELISPILSFIFYFFLYRKADLTVYIIFLFTPFIAVPFGLCINSLVNSKELISIFSTLFTAINSIPPDLVSGLMIKYGYDLNGKKKMFVHSSLLLAIITPFYYTASLKYFILSQKLLKLQNVSKNVINSTVDILITNLNYQIELQLLFLGLIRIPPIILYILVILSTVCLIILGAFFSGIKNKPNMRMQTEKDQIVKTV